MKKPFIFILLALNFCFLADASARIREETLKKGETLTTEKLFLNQVDTLCLYFATDRIAYVPKLLDNEQLQVSMTLLDLSFEPQSESLKNFVLERIQTFNKALKERLTMYTPELAKEFDANEDVSFVISSGPEKKKVAEYAQETWAWVGGRGAKVTSNPTSAKEELPVGDDCKEKCPALKKSREEKERVKIQGEDLPL